MNTPDPIGSLADIETIERIPWRERIQATNTYEIIRRAAAAHGERTAFKFLLTGEADEEAQVVSYADLLAEVTRTANLLHRLGVGKDDVVSYILPNLVETHYVIWGGEAAGIINAINPFLEAEIIRELLKAAGTSVLVIMAENTGAGLWEKVIPVLDDVPSIRAVVEVSPRAMGGSNGRAAGAATPGGLPIVDFHAALAAEPGETLVSGRVIAEDDIAAYFHTGGTTGVPKLARHTHLNQAAMALQASFNSEPQADRIDVIFCGLPLFHVNGVMVTGLNAFLRGITVVILTPAGYRTPAVIQNFWKLVEKYGATTFSAVPTIYAMLLKVPVHGADISSLRYAVCGAAPMPRELFRQFQDVTGIEIMEGYGLTEGTCVSACNPVAGERRLGSIGIRVPYQEMKAVELDAAGEYVRDCGVDESGIIAVRGPNVFSGYLQEEANKGAFLPDGWMLTGDIGRVDGDGYFWLTGRHKDIIIRGGHNIDPSLAEECLAGHPAVSLVAVVGQPDAHAGEVPVAYVTLKPGAAASADELKAFAREGVAERAAAPLRVEIIEAMPVTAVGKIFKPDLRRRATCFALGEALAEVGIEATVEIVSEPGGVGIAEIDSAAPEDDVRRALSAFSVEWRRV